MADIGAEDMASKKLTELRVVDLKIELEKRSLEKTGVKQALLERLKKAMAEEGLDLECHLFQVATPSSVKISKKAESFQERMPNCEDVHSDTSELISLGYETDEKDISLEICHIIDEDNQEPEEDYCQTEHLMTKDTKCKEEEEDILDEDLSCHEDDPVKLCIDECQSPEANIECTPESISSQKKDSPPPIIEPIIPLESKEVDSESETATPLLSNQIASPSLNQSEKISEDKTSKGEGVVTMQRNTTPTTEEKHNTNKEELKSPQPQNSSKPSEVQLGSSDTARNEKSSSQNPKLHPKEVNVAGRNLWVSGLSSSTRATDLKNLFSKYGKVTGAKVVTNAKSPGSKCYGFVTMTSTDEASKCIQHLHRTELHGRIISVERAKADPSQVTIDKISNQASSDKGKGNVERSRTESASKSTHRTVTHETTKEKKEAVDKPSSTDRKRERSPIRTTRRTSREVDSRDILTLEKIREERERERIKNWERTKRKDERKQQMMLQRERNRQRDVERMQREEAERLAKEREKLRLEKQRLELDRLKAERERVALEREKQRRERERLEEEREERRRELQRRGTKRPADSSSYWSESKRTAISPHSMRVHQRAELTQRESYKRDERIKHPEKISSRRDVEVILDHAKTSRKQSSPKIAWRPFGRLSTSPARRHSSRDGVQYVGENQNWHSSSSANRSRAYDNSYGQHWTDTRELLSSSRTWSSAAVPSNLGSLTSSGNVLMSSSGRIHTDATRYDGYKNLSTRRY